MAEIYKMIICWNGLFNLDQTTRCPKKGEWRSRMPLIRMMTWCNDHRHANDEPVQSTGRGEGSPVGKGAVRVVGVFP